MPVLLPFQVPVEPGFIRPYHIQRFKSIKYLIEILIGNIIFLRSFNPLYFSAYSHVWGAETRVITGSFLPPINL
jgi:hypothetical protein